jgi:Nif-specific regulatory protein
VVGFVYVDDRSRREPFSPAELEALTALAHLAAAALERTLGRRREEVAAALQEDAIPELVGESPPMLELKARVARFAAAGHASVLIRGESGSGKGLVARVIHARSPRAAGPFVAVNCAAIPEALIESELFGHVRGAFTGAARDRRGRFALADGGTLFLDEVGDLSPAAQAKLLKAIEEGEVLPVGGERAVRVDVRVLSATHRPIEDEIAAGRFREDLYYRLTVGELEVPALRARGDDVLVLAETFLAAAAQRMGRRMTGFGEAARATLRRYGWPGNVRQLQHEVERAVILGDGPLAELDGLDARIARSPSVSPPLGLAERYAQLDATERDLVTEAVQRAHGNLSEAARLLGVTRMILQRRVEKFGIKV